MSPKHVIWLVAAALVLALPGVVHAQTPPAASGETPPPPAAEPAAAADAPAVADKAKALEHFRAGVGLFEKGEWDAALAEFRRSRELYPTQVALENAALCLRELKRPAEALEAYQLLLETYGASMGPAPKRAASDALAALKPLVGSLTIRVEPAGATVFIDNLERGTTPFQRALNVNAGARFVRVYKEGFVPFETEVTVAGGAEKTVSTTLLALTSSGRLRVEEASGQVLDVLIDGGVVGKTPWEGVVPVGAHSVVLRGEGDLGTAPSALRIEPGRTESLKLQAVALDSRLRVEPAPSNAQVFIDGVQVGRGVWEGRLKRGAHTVEVAAEGFVAYRQQIQLSPTTPTVTRAELVRDLESPLWKNKVFRPHLFAEAMGGLMVSPSFRGSAASACDRGDCSDRSIPLGFLAGARGGYQLTAGLGVELALGYLRMKEAVTRSTHATSEIGTLTSPNNVDTTTLAGPFVAASASYRFFDKTPVVVRLIGGVARAKAQFTTSGDFTDVGGIYAIELSPAERSKTIWVPLAGPEISAGLRLGKRFEIRAGVAAFLLFPPATDRQGASNPARREAFALPPPNAPAGTPPLGYVSLPSETGFDTTFSVAPQLTFRADF